eukprot:CAMPEP_0170262576 /NCGR_PEP_ID=MMETSP0116_2-20130129/31172_1 /TAXON_ID=400756 /ORGANISM="Durinskia baltica, Strain CSIRO CS-38" /LENGTH=84 /DNA_ID=CAMNT_0010513647 /DNA_START=337 /DNA_END=588 /DNA_ORIENTATION=+
MPTGLPGCRDESEGPRMNNITNLAAAPKCAKFRTSLVACRRSPGSMHEATLFRELRGHFSLSRCMPAAQLDRYTSRSGVLVVKK